MAKVKKVGSRSPRASSPHVTTQRGKKSAQKTQRKNPASDLKTINKLSGKKTRASSQKKVQPVKKDTFKSNTAIALPHSVSLSVLNPFRLPISADQIAIATARFTGMAFVLIGALLTTYHLQELVHVDGAHMLAQATQEECENYLGSVENLPAGCTSGGTVIKTPKFADGTISLGEDQPASGIVDVFITLPDVPNDAKVELWGVPYEDDVDFDDADFFIGLAQYFQDETWKYEWDTTNISNGYYYLGVRAHYTNDRNFTKASAFIGYPESGLFKIRNTNTLNDVLSPTDTSKKQEEDTQIESKIDTPPDTVHESSADTATSTDIVDTVVPDADIPIIIDLQSEQPVSGVVTAYIHALGAEALDVELLDRSTGHSTLLKNVSLISEGKWKVRFDSTKYQNGLHRLQVNVTAADTSAFSSTFQEITIKNDVPVDGLDLEDNINQSETVIESITPTITIHAADTQPLSGIADIIINAKNVAFVELYATPQYSSVKYIIGLATEIDTGVWRYRWDTENTPNGQFTLTASVKNDYGMHDGGNAIVEIYNAPESSKPSANLTSGLDDTSKTEKIEEIEDQVIAKPLLDERNKSDNNSDRNDEHYPSTAELLTDFHDDIDDELRRLRTAFRSDDPDAIEAAKKRIDELEERVTLFIFENVDTYSVYQKMEEEVEELLERLKDDVERTENILRERVGEELNKDSDNDGVTDYDEINIYNTDPHSADTDRDGFNDGAEILNGYDPLDDAAEVLVTYESPKERGVIREDLIEVTDIQTINNTRGTTSTSSATASSTTLKRADAAVIFGEALPNSFVTVYVFSTPIVATVKTQDDGSWQYRFDKQLEDGEHIVYAGVTDNAGKIVAKSQPFTFIKTAQAFTPADAASASITAESDSLFETQTVILVVLSISVVAIGVVLIFVGLHLAARPKQFAGVDLQTDAVS